MQYLESLQCINYLLGRNKKPKSNKLHLNCDSKSTVLMNLLK